MRVPHPNWSYMVQIQTLFLFAEYSFCLLDLRPRQAIFQGPNCSDCGACNGVFKSVFYLSWTHIKTVLTRCYCDYVIGKKRVQVRRQMGV